MKSNIWISFDLGVRGDYESLYTWLDNKGARECGDSVALLSYEYESELLSELKKDIEDSIEITKKTRIYVIYRNPKTNKTNGDFIFGGRKAAPWSGYSDEAGQTEVDES
jgi:hypothetical protein